MRIQIIFFVDDTLRASEIVSLVGLWQTAIASGDDEDDDDDDGDDYAFTFSLLDDGVDYVDGDGDG